MRSFGHDPDTIRAGFYRGVMRLLTSCLALLVLITSCASTGGDDPGDLPVTDADHFAWVLAALDRPAVVNVWASWCVPCRSEAPLLRAAHEQFGDQISFIGVDVQDDQSSARAFVAEFGLSFPNYFDRVRSVPARLGGIGVPITYFVDSSGQVVDVHQGIIDEATLALGIDELLSR